MTNSLVRINPNLPIALLEVDDVLDNQHWKFCQDDGPDDAVGSYDEFEMGPEFILDAGTTVRIDHLWGFLDDGLSHPTDYVVTLPVATTVQRVVHVLLSHYHAEMDKFKASTRFYYIVQVSGHNGGDVEIVWGT
jgi:hypothetical protein